MRLPSMADSNASRSTVEIFGGYNHNIRIGESEFYDMENLTSDNYPVLSPRAPRGNAVTSGKASGMISKDGLCYVEDGCFVIGDERIDMGLSEGEKTMTSMGAYVIIMPDKKYINTANIEDRGDIEANVTTTETVSFTLCKIDGSAYEDAVAQDSAPATPSNLDLWIDTSTTPHSLKQYSSTTGAWTSIATTYVKIASKGIGVPFAVYDGVTISGVEDEALNDLNNTMIVWDRGDDFIIVTGIIDEVKTQTSPITVARRMPIMDFIIESENRLWGCRYGSDLTGNTVNEIYACKLGDFKNWNSFAGISTDSYAATVGTDGAFTGAVAHLGYPLFFKENHLHKVYGNMPSNYQIQTTACRGVQRGCHKSLAIVGETLFYKSRAAVCAYDGSLPAEISSALGNIAYTDAVAGVLGNKYYISMATPEKAVHTFVFDTARSLWHKEVGIDPLAYCNASGVLYFIDHSQGEIRPVRATLSDGGESVRWMAESGLWGESSPEKRYISRLDVVMWLDMASEIDFYIEYDSSGRWEHLFHMVGTSLYSFSVPIRPRRCHHFRLKVCGEGDAKVFSISKTIEAGGVMR